MDIHEEGNWQIITGRHACMGRLESPAKRGAQMREAPVLALDESGVIQECSASCGELFGYADSALVRQHISTLYPQLAGLKLFVDGRINPMLEFLCHCGHLFQASRKPGDTFLTELNFTGIDEGGRPGLRLIVRPLTQQRSPGGANHDHQTV